MNQLDWDQLEKEIRAHHTRDLAALDHLRGVIGRVPVLPLEPVQIMHQLPAPAEDRESVSRKVGKWGGGRRVAKIPRKLREPKVKPVRPAKATRGARTTQILAAIGLLATDKFRAEDLRPNLEAGITSGTLCGALGRLTNDRILTLISKGTAGPGCGSLYRRGPKWNGEKEIEEETAPAIESLPSTSDSDSESDSPSAEAVERPRTGPNYKMTIKPGDRLSCIRSIARAWGETKWLMNAMVTALKTHAAHTVDTAQKEQQARFQIMDLLYRGELTSIGRGATRYFTATAELADDDAPKGISSISVPRDADMEGSPE